MTNLAQQQQALLQCLFTAATPPPGATVATDPYFHGERGLQAYRANGLALAQRTLVGAFPVLAQLVGAESFAALSHEFWLTNPPTCGDLAQWGDALPLFLQTNTQLADEPYLPDVARVEWALHGAAGAADEAADMASFALLTSADAASVTLLLAGGTRMLQSDYPSASIVNAHLLGAPSLAEAGALLRAGTGERALVWRAGLRPQVRPCSADEAALVTALLRGTSLLASLEAAPGLDFQGWLSMAVQTGLVLDSRAVLTME